MAVGKQTCPCDILTVRKGVKDFVTWQGRILGRLVLQSDQLRARVVFTSRSWQAAWFRGFISGTTLWHLPSGNSVTRARACVIWQQGSHWQAMSRQQAQASICNWNALFLTHHSSVQTYARAHDLFLSCCLSRLSIRIEYNTRINILWMAILAINGLCVFPPQNFFSLPFLGHSACGRTCIGGPNSRVSQSWHCMGLMYICTCWGTHSLPHGRWNGLLSRGGGPRWADALWRSVAVRR